MGKFQDLTGQRFSELTVIKRATDYILPCGKPQTMWECECSCGRKIITRALQLKNGESKSCGHLQREIVGKMSKDRKGYNEYDLSGEYGVGYANDGKEFYFDLDDYDKIKNHHWYISNIDGYVKAVKENGEITNIGLHRLIMNVLGDDWKKVQVDHIHGDQTRNDNRKSNLRVVNVSQNGMNKKRQSNNTSGVTGVSLNKNKTKWRARIKINGKEKNLGEFINFEDAVNARKDAEKKYFGEYAYDYSQSLEVQ